MPARPNPAADLARMYRERIPTAPLSNYDKIIQSRLAPHRFTGGSSGLGFLRPVSNFLKTAVESLDPRFIASEGGRSVEHVYGDARELAKSVVTGEDTLSQSPSAQAYQAAGGGLGGALAAALPYVNVATAVVPTTKVFTPAGRVALAADAAERVASRQLGQAISQATPTVRQATADATERLAQMMADADIPTLAAPISEKDFKERLELEFYKQKPIARVDGIERRLMNVGEGEPLATAMDYWWSENTIAPVFGKETLDFLKSEKFLPIDVTGRNAAWQKSHPMAEVMNDKFVLQFNPNGGFIDIYQRTPDWDYGEVRKLPYLGQVYGQNILAKLSQFLNRPR